MTKEAIGNICKLNQFTRTDNFGKRYHYCYLLIGGGGHRIAV